jgi:opacity protein-like surface antigen
MYTYIGKKIPAYVVITTALSASSMALANVCDHIQSYIGGDLSYSKYRYTSDFKDAAGGGLRTKTPGLGIIGGIRYDENFGAEVGYTIFREIKNNAPRVNNKLKSRNTHLDLLGYVPIATQVELVGSVGLGHMRTLGKLSRTGVRLGAGAQYNLDNNWSLRAMARYQKIGSKTKDSNLGLFKNISSANFSVSYLL